MTDSMPKNGPYDPATDEQIEYWQVQVDYGAKIVVGPIARDMLGAILARLVASERERDEARKAHCEAQHEAEQIGYDERGTSWQNGPCTPREIAVEEYGEAVAARLFPPEVKS
jgi:hypothetical protein